MLNQTEAIPPETRERNVIAELEKTARKQITPEMNVASCNTGLMMSDGKIARKKGQYKLIA